MGNPLVIWALVCLGLAAALFVVELFLPTGGVIGVTAAAALVAGIVLLFMTDTRLGLLGAVIVLVGSPFVMALAVRIWPSTPVARMLTLRSATPGNDDGNNPSVAGKKNDAIAALPGNHGKAITDLHPVGTCVIEGRRYECLAESSVIHAGSEVEVVNVTGREVRVREVV